MSYAKRKIQIETETTVIICDVCKKELSLINLERLPIGWSSYPEKDFNNLTKNYQDLIVEKYGTKDISVCSRACVVEIGKLINYNITYLGEYIKIYQG